MYTTIPRFLQLENLLAWHLAKPFMEGGMFIKKFLG